MKLRMQLLLRLQLCLALVCILPAALHADQENLELRRMPDGEYEELVQIPKSSQGTARMLEEEALAQALQDEDDKEESQDSDNGVSVFDEERDREKSLNDASSVRALDSAENAAEAIMLQQRKGLGFKLRKPMRRAHIGHSIVGVLTRPAKGSKSHRGVFKSRYNSWPRGAPYISSQAHYDWAAPAPSRRYHLGPSRRRIGAGYWAQRHPKAWSRWRHPWLKRTHSTKARHTGKRLTVFFHGRRRRRTKVWAGWPYKFGNHHHAIRHHKSIIRPFNKKKKYVLVLLDRMRRPALMKLIQQRRRKLGFRLKRPSFRAGHVGSTILGRKFRRAKKFYGTAGHRAYDWRQQQRGPTGHFHLGQSRRRIGAGFGTPSLDKGLRKPDVYCKKPECAPAKSKRHQSAHMRVRYSKGVMSFSNARRRRTKLYYRHAWHRKTHAHGAKSILGGQVHRKFSPTPNEVTGF